MTALSYDPDLSEAEWAILAPLLAPPPRRGRPRKHDLRVVLNAILYILRGGDPWRLLPHEFPPGQSVSDHFRRWRQKGTWRSMPCVRAPGGWPGAVQNPMLPSSTARRRAPARPAARAVMMGASGSPAASAIWWSTRKGCPGWDIRPMGMTVARRKPCWPI